MIINRLGILALLSLMSYTGLNAQSNNNNLSTAIAKNGVTSLDSITYTLNDSPSTDIISDQLDSLLNTWYVQNAFPLNDLKPSDSFAAAAAIELPDSVYIERLQNLNSIIPLPFNESVKSFIKFYLQRRPAQVAIMAGLSDYYFPLFEATLAKYNLPDELKYLPIIESALNPKIVSKAGASGLWQFMHGTAKMYGLEINSYVDERNDPIKSTDAAARFLKDLYTIYGDWHLAIAAYNCGPGNVNKAVRRAGGTQNFWAIYSMLPRETRGYIPIFIAANYVMNYGKEHQLYPVKPSFDILTDTVQLTSYVNFAQIAANMDIPIEEIRQLNPQYKHDIVPAKSDKPFALKLPFDKIASFIDSQDEILAYNRDKYFPDNRIVAIPSSHSSSYSAEGKSKIYYTVRRGENPGLIANKFKVSVSNLCKWNNIRHNLIRTGQRLAIYTNEKEATVKVEEPLAKVEQTNDNSLTTKKESRLDPISAEKSLGSSQYTLYVVRSGDSLYTIAKQFSGVSDKEIKELNNIKNTKGLMIGQTLKIPIKA